MGAQWKAKGKAEVAAAKGAKFTKLVKEVMVAARGGPDPDMNSKLRMAIDAAKKASTRWSAPSRKAPVCSTK